jgi:hypothetical protein
MAKKTTFTVTAPTGEVLTRTSENRTYTHAIIARPSYKGHLFSAGQLSKTDMSNHEFHVAMANGAHYLARSQPTAYHTAEQIEAERVEYAALAAQAPDAKAWAILKRDERIATVEANKAAGYYDRFVALTWCGRPDLAQKELAKASKGNWEDVQAVPVTVKA